MNDIREVLYSEEDLEPYIMDVLSLDLCSLFLHSTFVKDKNGIMGCYNKTGYGPLSFAKSIGTESALNLLISLMTGVYDARQHYIFTEEFEISEHTIYLDEKFTQIKLIYLPAKEQQSWEEKGSRFARRLLPLVPEEGKTYLEQAATVFEKNPFGHKAQLHKIEQLRGEVYLCRVQ